MKPIAEYQDYRAFMLDFFNEKKRRGAITWRSFAKKAGFSSSSYLMLVCQGKANLSEAGIASVAKSMNLTSSETAYFTELVFLNQSKLVDGKEKSLKKLSHLAKKCDAKVVSNDAMEYFANWHNAVVREIAPHAPVNFKTSNIGRQVLPEISAADVTRALKFLTATGMLVQHDDGTFSQTDKILTSGNKDAVSVALRSFHKQLGKLAIDALDNVPIDERNSSNMVIGITKEQYQKLVQKIIDFRREVTEIVTETDDMERVYCFQVNFFPLSHKISKKGEPDES